MDKVLYVEIGNNISLKLVIPKISLVEASGYEWPSTLLGTFVMLESLHPRWMSIHALHESQTHNHTTSIKRSGYILTLPNKGMTPTLQWYKIGF